MEMGKKFFLFPQKGNETEKQAATKHFNAYPFVLH